MEKKKYFIVSADALPEVFVKVAEAKRMLQVGEASTVGQAAAMVGISRSAFYKYKDAVQPFQNMKAGHIITLYALLRDNPGVLSNYLTIFAASGANILTINQIDLWMLGILALILTGFFYLFIRPIVYIAFDREFARSQKIPVEIFEYVLMMFIALTIVACLRMVGIVLAISLLTIPQMTANLFTYSFKKIIWLSIGIGFLGCLGGLFISYHWKVPSGASIIFFSILIYAVCKIGKSCCRKKS